ncbi:hypothetical protein [Polaromonas sp. C04]|uniref:hypothetical protein n=1 Tax=Polaromonas sp. C04 TaxID=1945857 RepID=UPI0009858958|nr:hypothetical protein [Polaromonas sp. C04]OOG58029.1 hypothetical protein B0E49_04135 [Polaromonas sp. C04]
MTKIAGYKFEYRAVQAYPHLIDAKALTITPMKKQPGALNLHEILDTITLAVEAGIVEQKGWVKQFFANEAAFEDFISDVGDYDECFRITDRWWQALAALAEVIDEEGFVSSQEIADTLVEYATETSQLNG